MTSWRTLRTSPSTAACLTSSGWLPSSVRLRSSSFFLLFLARPALSSPLLSVWRRRFTPEAVACFPKKVICVLTPPPPRPTPLDPSSCTLSAFSLSTCSHPGGCCMLAGTGDPRTLGPWEPTRGDIVLSVVEQRIGASQCFVERLVPVAAFG